MMYSNSSCENIQTLLFLLLWQNEMGGACGAYGGGKRCAQGSSGET